MTQFLKNVNFLYHGNKYFMLFKHIYILISFTLKLTNLIEMYFVFFHSIVIYYYEL